jgi:hypothetical protein
MASGCGWSPPPDINRTLTIHEVLRSIHTLSGRRVKVTGYMPTCGGLECGLFASKNAYAEFWRVIDGPKSKDPLPEFLSIGFDKNFDRKAGPLAGHYVVVTGRVSDECRDTFGRFHCTDRARDLIPTDIALQSQPDVSTRA